MNSRILKGLGRTFLPYLIPIVCYLAGSRLQLNGRDFAFIVLTLNYGGMSFGYSFGSKVLAAQSSKLPPEPEDPTDRMLRTVMTVLLFAVLFFIAGLSYDPEAKAGQAAYVGILLYLLSMMVRSKALRLEPYLDPMEPIDINRIWPLKASGVYAVVRHPAQAAMLLYVIAAMTVFANVRCAIVGAVVIVLIFIRTAREDRYLTERLTDYDQYKEQVTKRLVPYIW